MGAETLGDAQSDAPAGRRYESMTFYTFIVLNVFLPIYPVKRGFLEIHVSHGFPGVKRNWQAF